MFARLARDLPAYACRCVAIDTRTLAVFRMLVGVLVISDLLLRARQFSYFYTESGVVPRSLAIDMAPESAFSVYFFTTDATVTGALFFIQGLIAVQLILGYQAKLATFLTFLFAMSLDYETRSSRVTRTRSSGCCCSGRYSCRLGNDGRLTQSTPGASPGR